MEERPIVRPPHPLVVHFAITDACGLVAATLIGFFVFGWTWATVISVGLVIGMIGGPITYAVERRQLQAMQRERGEIQE